MYEINKRNNNIKLTRGDSFYTIVSMAYKTTGQIYTPVSGDSIRFALKKTYEDAEPLILKTIPIDTLMLHLIPNDTKELSFGSYVYDIEITKANGDVDTFIHDAIFEILPEVY